MKNFLARPTTNVNQKHPDEFSQLARKSGLGHVIKMVARMKNKLYDVFEISNTNSMLPMLDQGHIVIAKQYKQGEPLQVGDVVIYSKPPYNIIHRIVNIKYADLGMGKKRIMTITCLGDGNFWKDPPISPTQITHIVSAISFER